MSNFGFSVFKGRNMFIQLREERFKSPSVAERVDHVVTIFTKHGFVLHIFSLRRFSFSWTRFYLPNLCSHFQRKGLPFTWCAWPTSIQSDFYQSFIIYINKSNLIQVHKIEKWKNSMPWTLHSKSHSGTFARERNEHH